MALAAGGGLYGYVRLNANLRSVPLFGGVTGSAGTEKVDPFGHSPINILVIGSDARSNPVDCKLGGDCGPGRPNADVEMVVHIAADRSNATVMSVPRDLVTDLPACVDPAGGPRMPAHAGQINATLGYGPGCTVAAVHQLSGIPIDHFVMVDFAGVIQMSDAVGGAAVCVTGNVFDPYSHLKLAKGTHTLQGLAALEFVRSRHAFGDGSDLGRTYAQHLFLSAVIRNLKAAATLSNPGGVYSLAQAATRALTVDTGLGSIARLVALAADVDTVPTHRITFTTMQNRQDPTDPNRVVAAPAAQHLFDTIIADLPLTTAGGTRPSTLSPTPSIVATPGSPSATPDTTAPITGLNAVPVRVENGSGRAGLATAVAKALAARGVDQARAVTAQHPAGTTLLRYPAQLHDQATRLATALGLPASALQTVRTQNGLLLVIGGDWRAGTTFPPSAGPSLSAAETKTALAQAHAHTADQASTCAPVSTQRTVTIRGIPMTPGEAYADQHQLPDSAP